MNFPGYRPLMSEANFVDLNEEEMMYYRNRNIYQKLGISFVFFTEGEQSPGTLTNIMANSFHKAAFIN